MWELPRAVDRRHRGAAARMGVLEQLEHVVGSGNAQLRRLHHAIGKTDDGAEVALDDLPLPQHLAAEKAAVEPLGALEVGNRVRRVRRSGDFHIEPFLSEEGIGAPAPSIFRVSAVMNEASSLAR